MWTHLRPVIICLPCLWISIAGLAAEPTLEDDEAKTLYTLGIALSQPLANHGLSAADVSLVQAGLGDGLMGLEPRAAVETYAARIEEVLSTRLAALAVREREAGQAFMTRTVLAPGAVLTDSGMIYFEEQAGVGASPQTDSIVKMHYSGSLPDGRVFDSSIPVGEPVTFDLSGVPPCFLEGVLRMQVGGKSRLVCPPDLAYGDEGFPPRGPKLIPPGATLVFEVELVEIVRQAVPLETVP